MKIFSSRPSTRSTRGKLTLVKEARADGFNLEMLKQGQMKWNIEQKEVLRRPNHQGEVPGGIDCYRRARTSDVLS
jgi:hypothetical protein